MRGSTLTKILFMSTALFSAYNTVYAADDTNTGVISLGVNDKNGKVLIGEGKRAFYDNHGVIESIHKDNNGTESQVGLLIQDTKDKGYWAQNLIEYVDQRKADFDPANESIARIDLQSYNEDPNDATIRRDSLYGVLQEESAGQGRFVSNGVIRVKSDNTRNLVGVKGAFSSTRDDLPYILEVEDTKGRSRSVIGAEVTSSSIFGQLEQNIKTTKTTPANQTVAPGANIGVLLNINDKMTERNEVTSSSYIEVNQNQVSEDSLVVGVYIKKGGFYNSAALRPKNRGHIIINADNAFGLTNYNDSGTLGQILYGKDFAQESGGGEYDINGRNSIAILSGDSVNKFDNKIRVTGENSTGIHVGVPKDRRYIKNLEFVLGHAFDFSKLPAINGQKITNNGTVIVTGKNAHGIHVEGSPNNELLANGSLQVQNDGAIGIFSDGAKRVTAGMNYISVEKGIGAKIKNGNFLIIDTQVTAEGGATAIEMDEGDSVLELNSPGVYLLTMKILGRADGLGGEDTLILGSHLSEFSSVDDLRTFDISDLRNFEKIVAKDGRSILRGTVNLIPSNGSPYATQAFDNPKTYDIKDASGAKGDLYVAGKLNIAVNYAGINDQGTDKTGKIIARNLTKVRISDKDILIADDVKIIGKDNNGRPFTENQRTIDSIGEINLVSDGSANQNIIGEITATTPNAKEFRVKNIATLSGAQVVAPDLFSLTPDMETQGNWKSMTIADRAGLNGSLLVDQRYMRDNTDNTDIVSNPVVDPVIPDPVIPDPVIPDPVIPDPVIPDPVIPDPVIPDPVIPDPVIPDPVIPDPVIPDPVIPDPVIPDPVIPDPVIPDPVIPDPVIPDPVIPDPVIPDPVIPDPVIPDPVVPDPVVPDPVVPDPVVPPVDPVVPADGNNMEENTQNTSPPAVAHMIIPRNRLDLDSLEHLTDRSHKALILSDDLEIGKLKLSLDYLGENQSSNFDAKHEYNYDYKQDTNGIASTATYKVADQFMLGLGLSYQESRVQYGGVWLKDNYLKPSDNPHKESVRSLNTDLFARYRPGGSSGAFYLDGVLAYGRSWHDLSTNFAGQGLVSGEYNSHAVKTGLKGSYEIPLGNSRLSLVPSLGLDYLYVREGEIKYNNGTKVGSSNQGGVVGTTGLHLKGDFGKLRWNVGLGYSYSSTDSFHGDRYVVGSDNLKVEKLYSGNQAVTGDIQGEYSFNDFMAINMGYGYKRMTKQDAHKVTVGFVVKF